MIVLQDMDLLEAVTCAMRALAQKLAEAGSDKVRLTLLLYFTTQQSRTLLGLEMLIYTLLMEFRLLTPGPA